jgi:hypothetical protein
MSYAGNDYPKASFDTISDQRNTEELMSICKRNMKWKDAIPKDSLLGDFIIPRNQTRYCIGNQNEYKPSVDQTALIGTLLEDTQQTTLGPFIPPI